MTRARPRGTSNTNARGSAADRRRRKAWLLVTFGDGEKAPCHYCGEELDIITITVDRILPGCHGGRYTRGNIRPACLPCNTEEGSRLGHEQKRIKRAHQLQGPVEPHPAGPLGDRDCPLPGV